MLKNQLPVAKLVSKPCDIALHAAYSKVTIIYVAYATCYKQNVFATSFTPSR